MPGPNTPQSQPSITRPVTRELNKKSGSVVDASVTPKRLETHKSDKTDKKNVGKVDKTEEMKETMKDSKGAKESDGAKEAEASKTGIEAEFSKFKDELKAMFAGMLTESEGRMSKELSKQINGLESKFKASLDSIRKDLNVEMIDVRKEIEQTKTEVKSISDSVKKATESVKLVSGKVESIEKSLEFQYEQMKDMDKAQDTKREEITEELTEKIKAASVELKEKMRELDNKLMLLEKQDRKYNLLFYGFTEAADEDVFDILRESFIVDLQIDEERVRNMYFSNGHRFPSKAPGPKPIILRFTSFEDRELVLSNAHKYAGKKKRVLVDLPAEMKQERSRIAKKAFEIRRQEEKQTRIKDKGLDIYLEVRKDKHEKWQKRVV